MLCLLYSLLSLISGLLPSLCSFLSPLSFLIFLSCVLLLSFLVHTFCPSSFVAFLYGLLPNLSFLWVSLSCLLLSFLTPLIFFSLCQDLFSSVLIHFIVFFVLVTFLRSYCFWSFFSIECLYRVK